MMTDQTQRIAQLEDRLLAANSLRETDCARLRLRITELEAETKHNPRHCQTLLKEKAQRIAELEECLHFTAHEIVRTCGVLPMSEQDFTDLGDAAGAVFKLLEKGKK